MTTLPTGARLDILRALLKQELSSQNLAKLLLVSPAAIRHHLATLEALGLVKRRKIVTRPSRPTYLYTLSAQGMRVFPKRYELLLASIIHELVEREGTASTGEIVRAAARRIAASATHLLSQPPGRQSLAQALEWLEREFDWQADLQMEGAQARLTVHQCPFQDVPRHELDVCGLFFTSLIGGLVGAAVEHAGAASSPACCGFVISPLPR